MQDDGNINESSCLLVESSLSTEFDDETAENGEKDDIEEMSEMSNDLFLE